jgi:hypothetical protein
MVLPIMVVVRRQATNRWIRNGTARRVRAVDVRLVATYFAAEPSSACVSQCRHSSP